MVHYLQRRLGSPPLAIFARSADAGHPATASVLCTRCIKCITAWHESIPRNSFLTTTLELKNRAECVSIKILVHMHIATTILFARALHVFCLPPLRARAAPLLARTKGGRVGVLSAIMHRSLYVPNSNRLKHLLFIPR